MSKPKEDFNPLIKGPTFAWEDGYAAGLREGERLERRASQKLRKATEGLCKSVLQCLSAIDAEMKLPSTPERGKRIAAICNVLEFNNDQVRYFTLGINYRNDSKLAARSKRAKPGKK